jgi:hypothetical protein
MHDQERPLDFSFFVEGDPAKILKRQNVLKPLGNDAFEKACVRIYL